MEGLMKKILLISIIFIILTNCAPSPEKIQKSIEETIAAIPTPTATPTPTPIPLSEIDLTNSLLVEGDLPQGFVAKPVGKITNNPILENIKGYDQIILQEFSKENQGLGIVSVLLFKDLNDRDKSFKLAEAKLDESFGNGSAIKNEKGEIGENNSRYFQTVFGKITTSAIIFVRCHAFVYMGRSMEDQNLTVLRAYAKRLDERLSALVCQ
jgi:hypothetical protein